MKYPTEKEVEKLGPVIRGLAGFIFFCCVLLVVLTVILIVFTEFELGMLVGLPMAALLGHVSGSVVFKGYAPKYLLFAHGAK